MLKYKNEGKNEENEASRVKKFQGRGEREVERTQSLNTDFWHQTIHNRIKLEPHMSLRKIISDMLYSKDY